MLSAWNFLRTVFCIPAFAVPDAVIALVTERCLLEPVRWFCCRFNYLRCLGLDATNLRRDLTLRSVTTTRNPLNNYAYMIGMPGHAALTALFFAN